MSGIPRIMIVLVGTIVLAQMVPGLLAIAIGSVALIVWAVLDSGRQSRLAMMREYGLTQDEAEAAERSSAIGDEESAIKYFEDARDRQFEALREQGIDPDSIVPMIGKDIAWSDIVRQVFRVLEFDRGATTMTEDGTVKAASSMLPYGTLRVDSPILNVKADLPIVHRDDFFLASTVYDDPNALELAEQGELLVTYYPEHKLPGAVAGPRHALHYVIVPEGTIERFYDSLGLPEMQNPPIEGLFKRFVWHGTIRVEINLDPEI